MATERPRRNLSTPEMRAWWRTIDDAARAAQSIPAWKKSVEAVTMSSDDVRPATDEEVERIRRLAGQATPATWLGVVTPAVALSLLARLDEAERARDMKQSEANVHYHAYTEQWHAREAAERREAYQRARADALADIRRYDGPLACVWCGSFEVGAHYGECPKAMPAEMPADYEPGKE